MNNVQKEIFRCPKYKKRYYMEVVSVVGQVNAYTPNKVSTVLLCPVCGDYHTKELGENTNEKL